ncbi:MAG: hypothetical protein WCI17_10200, partial [bacterium]
RDAKQACVSWFANGMKFRPRRGFGTEYTDHTEGKFLSYGYRGFPRQSVAAFELGTQPTAKCKTPQRVEGNASPSRPLSPPPAAPCRQPITGRPLIALDKSADIADHIDRLKAERISV